MAWRWPSPSRPTTRSSRRARHSFQGAPPYIRRCVPRLRQQARPHCRPLRRRRTFPRQQRSPWVLPKSPSRAAVSHRRELVGARENVLVGLMRDDFQDRTLAVADLGKDRRKFPEWNCAETDRIVPIVLLTGVGEMYELEPFAAPAQRVSNVLVDEVPVRDVVDDADVVVAVPVERIHQSVYVR